MYVPENLISFFEMKKPLLQPEPFEHLNRAHIKKIFPYLLSCEIFLLPLLETDIYQDKQKTSTKKFLKFTFGGLYPLMQTETFLTGLTF